MAPEQASDPRRADQQSDIYSLGCTLHFLLTGRPPYSGKTWTEILLAHQHSPVPSLKAARPAVPHHLEHLFQRMLAKDPANRPPSMGAVVAAVELALAESRARPSSSPTIPVHRPAEPDLEPFFDLEALKTELLPRPAQQQAHYVGPVFDLPKAPGI